MHVHRRRILIAAALAVASAYLLAPGVPRAEEEERPKIFLEKKVFADTSEGKKNFFEVHTVARGENLWKILHGKGGVSGPEYGRRVKEFRRANPGIADPGKLKVGQKILIPSALSPPARDERVVEGKAAPHRVVRGDTLTQILADRGVTRHDVPKYLDAVKKLNESVRDVNRILAGSTVLIPTAEYFGTPPPQPVAAPAPPPVAAPAVEAPPPPQPEEVEPPTAKVVTAPAVVPAKTAPEPPSAKVEPPPEKKVEPPPPKEVAKVEPPPAPKEIAPPKTKEVAAPPVVPPKAVPSEPPQATPVQTAPVVMNKAVEASPPVKEVTKVEPPLRPGKKVEPPQAKPVQTAPVVMNKAVEASPPAKVEPPPPPVIAAKPSAEEPAMPLTKEAPPQPVPAADTLAKPEGQLATPPAPPADAPAVVVKPQPAKIEPPKKEEPPLPPPKPPYRGMLSDLIAGLGEKLADRGTLYLPVPSGGEVVLNLEDFPVARFSNGTHALIDFRGALPANIKALVTETWKNYRVVSMEGTRDPWDMIHRLLQASGYHSVKDGLVRPLVIGEGISVTLPARWVVLRTRDSLLAGEVILIKEVPEKPSGNLAAVLRYADRVGIRVLPMAADPGVSEGFLIGLGDPAGSDDPPPRLAAPAGGLAALDFALDFLGLPRKEGERLRIGGKGDSFQLIVQPERLFEAMGKRYLADTGKMAPALKTLVRDSGYKIFPISREDTGKTIFLRVMKEAGIASEARRDHLLSGGERDGYAVRATGTFVTSKDWLDARKTREALLFGGRSHTATRALMRDLGVDLLEW